MRNLKRVLSLALAALMLMGMMVVGAGAASKDFTDADEITNVEAVDVMVALGVLEGGDKGDFQPNSILTREQAAKIICYMLLGEENAEKLTTNYSIFSDVPANRWSAPYISYCVNLGILAGDGNGHFYPEGKLTGVAFAKMLLVCLGYSADRENYVGNNWEINTSAAAIAAGIAPKELDLSKELSRQDAAQMAFNTLTATMVEYLNDNTIIIGGETIISTTGKASAVKQYPYEDTMNTEYLQFAEKYFGKLKKLTTADEFDRPAHTWNYKGEEVGTYVNWDQMVGEYTTSVSGKDLYNLLTATTIKNYGFNYYVDGKLDTTIKASNMIRTNTKSYSTTGNGVLTQVFVDNDNEEITITSINTYLAVATADYNAKKETLSLKVYDAATGTPKTIALADFAGIENYKEGDYLLVNWAETNTANNYEVAQIADPEVMTDKKITKYSDGNYVVTDGTQYDYGFMGTVLNEVDSYYNQALTNYTYNLYLDQYGYVAGITIYSGEANYVFITGYDRPTSHLYYKTANAGAIFLDGTMSEIQVNVTDTNSNLGDKNASGTIDGSESLTDSAYALLGTGKADYNKWFTYTTTEKSGETVYTLTPVANWVNITAGSSESKINCASVRLKNGAKIAYGNDDSVYLTVDTGSVSAVTDKAITKVTGTYTGVQNVDLTVSKAADNALTGDTGIFAVYDSDLYIIGAVVVGEDTNSTKDYAYALKDAQNEYVDADNNYYWDFVAVVDGEVKTLTVKEKGSAIHSAISASLAVNHGAAAMFELTYDADGYVVGAELCEDADSNVYGNTEFVASTPIATTDKIYDVALDGGASESLRAVGRTLYVDGYENLDVGLTIATDAPVVLVQKDSKGATLINEYTTIAQALSALEDNDSNTLNGVQFAGRVSAVLNSNGTAKYLVIKSETPVPVITDDGSIPSGDGKLSVLSMTYAGGNFTVNVATKVALTAGDTITVDIYQNGFKVASLSKAGGAATAGTAWSETVPASVATANGEYTVVVKSIHGSNVVASGTATLTIQ